MRVAGIFALSLFAATECHGQQIPDQQSTPPVQQNPPVQPVSAAPQPIKSTPVTLGGATSADTTDQTKDPDQSKAQTPDKGTGTDATPDTTGGGGGGGGGSVDPADYTGPAILSRGYALSAPNLTVNQPLRFYAGINMNYSSGLLGNYSQTADLVSAASGGLDVNWGASYARSRTKSVINFNYNGDYSEYISTTKSSGQNHSLGAGYIYRLSPQISIGIHETAGLSTSSTTILNTVALADSGQMNGTSVVSGNTEAFSNTSYYATTSASLSYAYSARLNFSISGSYFLVDRNAVGVANTSGYSASGNASYRLTQRQTLGTYYSHNYYSFTRILAHSDSDGVGLSYGLSLSRTMDLSVSAGGSRYDTQTLDTVIPNPLVQIVLGLHSGIEKDYFIGYSPEYSASLSRKFRRSSLSANYSEGISPGNGLVLTSRSQSESVAWSLPTFRSWAAQVGAGRSALIGSATGNGSAATFSSYYARFSVSRPITTAISGYFNFDYRQDGFGGSTYHQKTFAISLGFRFSPGPGSMKFW